MQINSTEFIKGIVGADPILENGIPQIAFIGRSNAGKSSTINIMTRKRGLARTSAFPGRTREINVFLINKSFYLVDLPGYGFSTGSEESRRKIFELINWYLFTSGYAQKFIVLIVDANIGPTESDLEILRSLEDHKKNVVIAANKTDRIRKSEYKKQIQKIQDTVGNHKVIPYSAKTGTGVGDLIAEVIA
jgi:GTP-binding protein